AAAAGWCDRRVPAGLLPARRRQRGARRAAPRREVRRAGVPARRRRRPLRVRAARVDVRLRLGRRVARGPGLRVRGSPPRALRRPGQGRGRAIRGADGARLQHRDSAAVPVRVRVPGRAHVAGAGGSARVSGCRLNIRESQRREKTVKMRLIGGLVLVGLVGLLSTSALGGVKSQAHKAGTMKIGVSLAGYSTDFWSSYVSFESAAAKKYGVSLVGPISANGDAGKQATQIRTLIDEGVDALIIKPVDSAALSPMLVYAASKHLRAASVDVPLTQRKVYMIVRADNVLYGQSACQYITSHVKGSGHVAMLEGDLASINGLDRKNGFLSCMKSHPNLKVVEY